MKAELLSLKKQVVGEVVLDDSIFGLDERADIIKRVIDWQRAKARSVSHSIKTVGEVSGTTKKPFKQKGTGNARQGNARAVQRRGGGVSHGPQVRSYDIKLQKKLRKLGLKHALSSKKLQGNLHIIDSIAIKSPKTSCMLKSLSNFGVGKFLVIDSAPLDNNFRLSSASASNITLIPMIGTNVYDLIRSNHVLISKNALMLLEKRLK